ncbi:MAG TPA: alpha/beta hydrolase domain-containing protein [Terriglobales bacterium]|nr:alpha/beta hydrolase domain-containing protein [Terriglobales bacterium]
MNQRLAAAAWHSAALLAIVCLFAGEGLARVQRVEITRREDVLGGKPWGNAGAYEKLVGRVYFSVKPENAHNRQIIDLPRADRNAAGEVEFSSDVYILRPKESSRGNGALLLEISNRGGKGILAIMNGGRPGPDPTTEEQFGDGFLLRNGYTVAWLGWQWDVRDDPSLVRLYAPVARGPMGAHLRGPVRTDFTLNEARDEAPLAHLVRNIVGGQGYAAADADSPYDVLTVRDAPLAARQPIERSRWKFARMAEGKLTPDRRSIHLDGGFQPGKIYELVYYAEDPVVAGLGLAAVRDFASYVKNDKQAVAPVARAYTVGISQSGRFLRQFLFDDFNADEDGRQVFDGMISHVAGAGRGSFNHRFAQPSRDGQPMSAFFFPVDIPPFATTGPCKGCTGLLDRAAGSNTAPKIFLSNTSYEYWSRAASLIHTSYDAKGDLAPDPRVRIYMFAGLQHASDPFPPQRTEGQQRNNANPVRFFWRAMLTNLDAWVARGVEPPPTTVPRVADGTLVTLDKLKFPKIPGINVPRSTNLGFQLDFGPHFTEGIITQEPPKVLATFGTLVPQTNADGNDLGGVTPPELAVPLATYTGWNLRSPQISAPEQRTSFLGSYIPFARTAAERAANHDPRLSLAERYPSYDDYQRKYRAAIEKLIQQRFLLREDLPALMERGQAEWQEAMK